MKNASILLENLMLFKNQWTVVISVEFTTRGFGDFEDLEPELLRLSKLEPSVANYRRGRISRRIYGHKDTFNSRPETEELVIKAQSFL